MHILPYVSNCHWIHLQHQQLPNISIWIGNSWPLLVSGGAKLIVAILAQRFFCHSVLGREEGGCLCTCDAFQEKNMDRLNGVGEHVYPRMCSMFLKCWPKEGLCLISWDYSRPHILWRRIQGPSIGLFVENLFQFMKHSIIMPSRRKIGSYMFAKSMEVKSVTEHLTEVICSQKDALLEMLKQAVVETDYITQQKS